MIKRNHLLRIAVNPIRGLRDGYQENGITKLRGLNGAIITKLWSLYAENFTFVLSDQKDGLGGQTENGTYNGIIGLVMNEKADVTSWPTQLTDCPDNLRPTPVTAYEEGALLSFPAVEPQSVQLLNSFNVFSHNILGFILMVNLCLAILYSIMSCKLVTFRTVTFFDHQFQVTRCFIKQDNWNWLEKLNPRLTLITAMTAFFILEIFESGISADSSTVDFSQVSNLLTDIVRAQKKVILLHNHPISLHFKYHQDSLYKSVYNQRRSQFKVDIGDPELKTFTPSENLVYIVERHIAHFLGNYFSPRMPLNRRGYWIGQSWADSVSLAMHTAPNIQLDIKSKLDEMSQLHLEFGTFEYVGQSMSKAASNLAAKSGSNHKTTLMELVKEQPIVGITVDRSLSLMLSLIALLCIASALLWFETCKVQSMRRAIKLRTALVVTQIS